MGSAASAAQANKCEELVCALEVLCEEFAGSHDVTSASLASMKRPVSGKLDGGSCRQVYRLDATTGPSNDQLLSLTALQQPPPRQKRLPRVLSTEDVCWAMREKEACCSAAEKGAAEKRAPAEPSRDVCSLTTSRQWDREFQEELEAPVTTINEEYDRLSTLDSLIKSFAEEFTPAVETAVSEMHLPQNERTYAAGKSAKPKKKQQVGFRDTLWLPETCQLPPIDMGKPVHCVVSITVFKNEADAKRAAREHRNNLLLMASGVRGLSPQLSAIVVHNGYTAKVAAEAGLSGGTPKTCLVYACSRVGKKRVLCREPEAEQLLLRATEALNLKPTPLSGGRDKGEHLAGPPQIEVAAVGDGRLVVSGLADLMPAFPPNPGAPPADAPTLHLRPELVFDFAEPLSPCSFLMAGLPQHAENNAAVRRAAAGMLRAQCAALAEFLATGFPQPLEETELFFQDRCAEILSYAHLHGVNAAALPVVHSLLPQGHPVRLAVSVIVHGKAAKRVLFRELRRLDVSGMDAVSSRAEEIVNGVSAGADAAFARVCEEVAARCFCPPGWLAAEPFPRDERSRALLVRFLLDEARIVVVGQSPRILRSPHGHRFSIVAGSGSFSSPPATAAAEPPSLASGGLRVAEVQSCPKTTSLVGLALFTRAAAGGDSPPSDQWPGSGAAVEAQLRSRVDRWTAARDARAPHAAQLLVLCLLQPPPASAGPAPRERVKEGEALAKARVAFREEELRRRGVAVNHANAANLCGRGVPEPSVEMMDLARFYDRFKAYRRAEDVTCQVLQIRESNPRMAAEAEFFRGCLQKKQACVEDAVETLNRALTTHKIAFGEESLRLVPCYTVLAALYEEQGQSDNAEPLRAFALQTRIRALGKMHVAVSTALNNLAVNLYEQQRYDDAEPLYKLDLQISERLMGPDHEDVATSMNNLASLYDMRGAYEKSIPLYLKDLEITTSKLGKMHPKTAISLNNLASSYTLQGRFDQALELYEQCLEIRKAVNGEDSVLVAETLSNLGTLLFKKGILAEAKENYKQCITLMESGRADTQKLISVVTNMQALCEAQQEFDEVERWGDMLLELKRADATLHQTITGCE
eukprot:gene14994-22890_t